MMDAIHLAVFVRAGTFGPLAIDSPVEVARDLLGEPDDVGRGLGAIVIHRYGRGRLEVSLLRDRVVLIAFYPRRGIELPHVASVVDDLPAAELSADALRQWLEKEGLRFEILTDEGETYGLRVRGGATATFVDNVLDSLQVS